MLEKTLESPLNCKEIKPKGNQSWIFIRRTDAEAETPILWPPNANNWLIWKAPDARKDWGQEEKGTTEDEIVGWHHQLNGHELEQAPGVGDRQEGLACCSPWGHKESDTTERLNWTELQEAGQEPAIICSGGQSNSLTGRVTEEAGRRVAACGQWLLEEHIKGSAPAKSAGRAIAEASWGAFPWISASSQQ